MVVRARPLPIVNEQPTAQRVGRLIPRGGLELASPERRFGGWSTLWLAPDRRRLISISDRGAWMEAVVEYDADGHLAGLGPARIGAMIDVAGRPLRPPFEDAEAMARMPDGGFAVAFETRPRIWIYPAADPPLTRPPRALPQPPGLETQPPNRGIEALAHVGQGRLVALGEYGDGAHPAWLWDGRAWSSARYRAARGFHPSDACGLPDGGMMVLERAFRYVLGFQARIVRVAAGAIAAGHDIEGEEIAFLDHRHAIDNYEGIAVAGDQLMLIADDNFLFLQRTLLLAFGLPG